MPDNLFVNHITLEPWQLPFDLDLTLSCGQIFGWKKTGSAWSGVHNGKTISIIQNNSEIIYAGCDSDELNSFLGLNHDISLIIRSIRECIGIYNDNGEDEYFFRCYDYSKGIRILLQNPWECLISFICSANSNVPTISKRIFFLIEKLGDGKEDECNTFPTPHVLSSSSEEEVRECRAGYRAPYLIKTGKYIKDNPRFLEQIKLMEYKDAKDSLMTLSGVGPKVADCVLLFAYGRFEAVPVDVRIRHIITNKYFNKITLQKQPDNYSYDEIAEFCRIYFGPFAGYAQQYLYAAWNVTLKNII